MAKNKISEFSSNPANNTDIAGINIAEGCAPSGINNAIRELMAQLKDQQTGADSDGFVVGGAFTSSGGAVFSSGVTFSSSAVLSSTVTMSGTVSMNGTNNIGATTSSTILSGSVTQTTSSKLYFDDSVTTASAPPLSWDGDTDTGIYRPASNTMAIVTGGVDRLRVNSSGVVIIGSGEATTTVSGNILRAPSGSGTNIPGSDLQITSGNGTGTGGSGDIIFKTAAASGTSGSTANTMTQRLLITSKGGFSFGSGSTSYGTAGQVLKSNGDAPPSFGSVLTFQSSKSATGSNVDFTDIPSTARRITIIFSGVSLSGTSSPLIVQIGSGSLQTTGYLSTSVGVTTNGNSSGGSSSTTGFAIYTGTSASNIFSGVMVLTLLDPSGNNWISTHNGKYSSTVACSGGGDVTLTGVLDQLSIIAPGTTTFDAGTINIAYE